MIRGRIKAFLTRYGFKIIVPDDLFSIEADEKDEKLSIVLDSLASKFGEGAIMSGALWRRAHGDGGERRKRSELKAEIDLDNEE